MTIKIRKGNQVFNVEHVEKVEEVAKEEKVVQARPEIAEVKFSFDESAVEGNADEFNGLLRDVYKNVHKSFDFGGWSEYYNEDGLVIMTTEENQEGILFDFGTGETFQLNQNN